VADLLTIGKRHGESTVLVSYYYVVPVHVELEIGTWKNRGVREYDSILGHESTHDRVSYVTFRRTRASWNRTPCTISDLGKRTDLKNRKEGAKGAVTKELIKRSQVTKGADRFKLCDHGHTVTRSKGVVNAITTSLSNIHIHA
jgi:hypothetical protein